ncbi:AmpG family muropeptide MFS transporter [Chitiniphilus shinanonensis]|uniref:AmpG family muropeptide MFS transporter n=1 Tax=Chitiniphilus shinanonensis TaxID=553088 RepID=A0ABQ6BPB8_9NEIS|nr:MFS transporter [Chitiniphilus shinanonensis]GLS03020.1 AmpG family muropeptide MFS transporter [Chitiniphilus shinanonensis]
MRLANYFAVFSNRRIAAAMFLGFASGLPLALTGSTLQAWLSDAGLDVKTIGWFTLVGQPYTWKFLWAPLIDRFPMPFLGRRRGWMVLTQLLLALAIAGMGGLNPQQHLPTFAVLALLVAFFSSTQDVVIDAYRTELVHHEERGAAAAVNVFGYRMAMLTSGALALILADGFLSWQQTYWAMAGLMAVMVVVSFLAPEPTVAVRPPLTLEEAVIEPLREFFSRRGALILLALVVAYKLGDAFAGSLSTKFLLDMGYSKSLIGQANKVFGMIATIFGGFAGAVLMVRLGLYRSLLWFGLAQALTNLGYWLIATTPAPGKELLFMAIGLENLAGGMGTTASVALLMALCNVRFTATQYALLSALAAFGRVYVGPASGYIVDTFGWAQFFVISVLVALPGVALVWWMRERIRALDHDPAA